MILNKIILEEILLIDIFVAKVNVNLRYKIFM